MRLALAPFLMVLSCRSRLTARRRTVARLAAPMAVLLAAVIFAEGNIQYPMLAVLDTPVTA